MSELNDPRLLFSAARTLLAWTQTSMTLMGFGFVIERFGLFIHLMLKTHEQSRDISFWVGIAFVALGACCALTAALQFRRLLKTLQAAEIPDRYNVHLHYSTNLGVIASLIIAILGIALTIYLFATH